MSTALTYGIYLGLANIVLSLTGYYLGYQTENIAEGKWFQYLSWVAVIVFVFLGLRARREADPHKSLSYGRGVGTATMIGLWAGIIGSIYAFIYLKFINPEFVEYLVEFSRAEGAAKGLSEAQLDQQEAGMRMVSKPVVFSIFAFIGSVVMSLVVGLIAAAILKRRAPEGAVPPPM